MNFLNATRLTVAHPFPTNLSRRKEKWEMPNLTQNNENKALQCLSSLLQEFLSFQTSESSVK